MPTPVNQWIHTGDSNQLETYPPMSFNFVILQDICSKHQHFSFPAPQNIVWIESKTSKNLVSKRQHRRKFLMEQSASYFTAHKNKTQQRFYSGCFFRGTSFLLLILWFRPVMCVPLRPRRWCRCRTSCQLRSISLRWLTGTFESLKLEPPHTERRLVLQVEHR